MKEAVIVSAVRTPLGSFNGSLGNIGATDLGAMVIKAAIKRAKIDKESVDEVLMGQVLPHGYGQNPAKQAAVKADHTEFLAGFNCRVYLMGFSHTYKICNSRCYHHYLPCCHAACAIGSWKQCLTNDTLQCS